MNTVNPRNRKVVVTTSKTSGMICALGIVLVLYSGCGKDATSVKEAKLPKANELALEPAEGTAMTSSKLVSRNLVPEAWRTPISEDDKFFDPPVSDSAKLTVVEASDSRQAIRLLGIASTDVDGDLVPRAILKIGDQMYYMQVGETRDGVDLVDLGKNSVTLQQGRDRLALSLSGQPIVNQESEFYVAPRRSKRRAPVADDNGGRRSYGASAQPVANSDFRFDADGSSIALPELPDVNELPDLPELPAMPDLSELPGFGP